MSNEIEVTCRIPAPPDGWVYDGWRNAEEGEMAVYEGDRFSLVDVPLQFSCHCAVRAPAEPEKSAVEIFNVHHRLEANVLDGALTATVDKLSPREFCVHVFAESEQPEDLPKGWTRDGKWILAPIEWDCQPMIPIEDTYMSMMAVDLGDLPMGYRCVGFRGPFLRLISYSILGDWRATHAVLLEESCQ